MNRGTRWTIVYGVAKSQTQLSDSHRHTHTLFPDTFLGPKD